ncbi:S-layer protein [filamentous cyanobacterium CCP2]|nr:S-layer protein [filamentous cyanobacterium CCP2]
MKQLFPLSIVLLSSTSLFAFPAAAQEVPNSTESIDCLSGYADGTFRGDQPVTRDEFAAGLNACLNQLEQQLDLDNYATRSEVEATIQYQRELNDELGILSDRLDELSGDSPQ